MKQEDLLYYEIPTIGDFVWFGWGQTIIAKYTVWKIERKWKRYQLRLERKKRIELIKGIVKNYEPYY